MSAHPDLPHVLVHFTGRPRGKDEKIPVPDFAHGSAEDRLVSILHGGVLRGNKTYWTDRPVACFSEITEEARRAMLHDGVHRGPYPPWGLMLDRAKLIEAGARPALYVSRREYELMSEELPSRTHNRCVVYEPHPFDGRRSDWLFEREWRLVFRAIEPPELDLAQEGLVTGVITGRPGWTPPPRRSVLEDSTWVEPAPSNPSSGVGPIGEMTMTTRVVRTRFAGPAHGLRRLYWDGEDLVDDGEFDIEEQQMRDSVDFGGEHA
ncbi:hypothetical protein ACFWB3_10320 [[Kitasatospora] papulosa]|uniref:hypothetical protein n=1 Tax=[Kitasatospora] papulosa TaxID=1464011 RepID=UPI00367E59EB